MDNALKRSKLVRSSRYETLKKPELLEAYKQINKNRKKNKHVIHRPRSSINAIKNEWWSSSCLAKYIYIYNRANN